MQALVTVVLPVFAIVGIGYLAARRGIFGPAATASLSRFVYYFALPALLFLAVARAPITEVLNGPFMAVVGGAILVTFAIALLLGRLVYRDDLAALAMRAANASFSNTGNMGIPVAITAFGAAGALPAVVATAVNVAMVISAVTVMIEVGQHRASGGLGVAGHVAAAVASNPLVLPVIAGGAVSALGLPLPEALTVFGTLLGNAVTPCALFALGLFIAGQPLRGEIGQAAVLGVLKLVVHPVVTWALLTWVFTLEPPWADVALLMAAMPTGVTAFVIAERYGVFAARTSATTLLTTAASLATVSLVLSSAG